MNDLNRERNGITFREGRAPEVTGKERVSTPDRATATASPWTESSVSLSTF